MEESWVQERMLLLLPSSSCAFAVPEMRLEQAYRCAGAVIARLAVVVSRGGSTQGSAESVVL